MQLRNHLIPIPAPNAQQVYKHGILLIFLRIQVLLRQESAYEWFY